jgi:hypothetical protein
MLGTTAQDKEITNSLTFKRIREHIFAQQLFLDV